MLAVKSSRLEGGHKQYETFNRSDLKGVQDMEKGGFDENQMKEK